MQSDVEQTWQSMLWYTLFNLTLAGTAGLGVLLISPEASGSGIPDIMAYLNGVDIDVAFFSLQTFLVKVRASPNPHTPSSHSSSSQILAPAREAL